MPVATIVDHEQSRTDELPKKGQPGETVIPITYKPSMEQVSALIAISDTCQQYIKYNCQNSYIWSVDNGWPYVWWISRHGKDMHNFGGVPTGQEGCACSLSDQGKYKPSLHLSNANGQLFFPHFSEFTRHTMICFHIYRQHDFLSDKRMSGFITCTVHKIPKKRD